MSIDISADVSIGALAVLSEEVLILTHDHSHPGFPEEDEITATPLVIGPRAFVGARAMIMPAVGEIGYGAMIGAGSVVTRDVPRRELWAGNPARFIRRV